MKDLKKCKIGVIMGGPSSERDVSLRSGDNVFKALKEAGYKAIKIDLIPGHIVSQLKQEKIDIAYIILHGAPGEDGTIQGLLEIMGIPYTGSGILGSAVSLNKIVTKQLLIANHLPVPPGIILRGIFSDRQVTEVSQLGFPVMLKPVREGSSIGLEKVNSLEELRSKIDPFLEKYHDGIIEKYIKGKDITVGVLEDDKEIIALPVLELVSENEFYDYEAKYTKGKTRFILPAGIDEAMTKKVKDLAVKAHQALWCFGVTRVDMVVSGNDVYILEVNSVPGMTETSDLPAEAREMGIQMPQLVEKILYSTRIKKKYMVKEII
ncbi:MAG: D-alanine--D-alanine ligase [Spirochaetes bacterium]|nr:D-alanine--D-alanine ligase [Spirochaetota bacterium]